MSAENFRNISHGAAPELMRFNDDRSYFATAGCLPNSNTIGGTSSPNVTSFSVFYIARITLVLLYKGAKPFKLETTHDNGWYSFVDRGM